MENAFAAAGIVAVVERTRRLSSWCCAGQTFAGHALSHVGFAGATGAVLVGGRRSGPVALTLVAGVGMGMLGERLYHRDVAIGIVLAMSFGLGLLFLHFFTAYARRPRLCCSATCWASTINRLDAVRSRHRRYRRARRDRAPPSVRQPATRTGRGKGGFLRLVSVLFLAITALGVAECAQIVGVLLVFALMVGPAAAAQRLTARFWPGITLSALLALAEAWLGLMLAYATDWPASFWITALSGAIYLLAVLGARSF